MGLGRDRLALPHDYLSRIRLALMGGWMDGFIDEEEVFSNILGEMQDQFDEKVFREMCGGVESDASELSSFTIQTAHFWMSSLTCNISGALKPTSYFRMMMIDCRLHQVIEVSLFFIHRTCQILAISNNAINRFCL